MKGKHLSNFSSKVSKLAGVQRELRRALADLDAGSSTGNPGGYGDVWYVDPNTGSDDGLGKSWDDAFDTMAEAFTHLASGDTIYFRGKVKEQVTAPVQVFDVSIIGASNRVRHADAAPVGSESGASWVPPDSPTAATPLLKVLQQGWTLANFLMDAPSDAPCVQLHSDAGAGNDERDASHFSAYGVRFTGGQSGIEGTGGQFHCLIADCEFDALTNAIKTMDTGIRVPANWEIRDSTFANNTNHLLLSMNYGDIHDNRFIKHTTTAITTKQVSSQGDYNSIYRNSLGGTYSIAGGYTGGSNDEWGGNFNSLSGGVTAADPA